MVSSYRPTVTSDCVIDVSHWNGAVDFGAVRHHAGIRAVFIKATQGAHSQGRDPLYRHNAEAAEAAGLLWAPYHFMTHESAAAQFAEIKAVVDLKPGSVVMLDWEGEHIPADIVAELGQMVEEETERAPLVYCGRWQLLHPHAVLSKWPLNLPEYGTHPVCPPGWDAWMFHQYTDKGAVSGVHGHVDRSVFAGTEDELEVWWLGKPAAVAAKAAPPAKAKVKPAATASAPADAVSPVTDESPLEHVLMDALHVIEKVI